MKTKQEALALIYSLTDCQRQIIIDVAHGLGVQESAAKQNKHTGTIKLHRFEAYKRLGINKAAQAAIICSIAGLIDDWSLPE